MQLRIQFQAPNTTGTTKSATTRDAAGPANHVGSLALQAELNGSETGAGSAGLTWNGSARSLRRVVTPLNPRSGEVDMWWCVVNGEAGKRRGRVYRHQQGGHRGTV